MRIVIKNWFSPGIGIITVLAAIPLSVLLWTQAAAIDGQQIGDPAQAPPPPTWSDDDQIPILDRNGNVKLDSQGREVTISNSELDAQDTEPRVTDDPPGTVRNTRLVTNADGEQYPVEEVHLPAGPRENP
ncbi:MAG: hypothetical protein H0V02_00885 [Nocardioidaceae bacterium]|nr:hypothetical protein [Nocardioidaceae bacterium]